MQRLAMCDAATTVVWIAAGVVIGIPLALSASRFARNLRFGLGATDIGTLIGTAIIMSVMGLLAGYIPARRMSRRDPLITPRLA
jgi:ABC-type antimicrobial peptide transport system permease subunit